MIYTWMNNQKVSKSLAECLYNLSSSQNGNSNDLTDDKISKYYGIVLTSVSVIMAVTGKNWYYAMLALNELLPLDSVNLFLIFPDSWSNVLTPSGNIDVQLCKYEGNVKPFYDIVE